MRVLIGCEKSGIVRDWFTTLGHDAWSCDLQPSDRPGNHLQCDIETVLHMEWDVIILFPECTAMCVSGNSTYAAGKPGFRKRQEAVMWTFDLWCKCLFMAQYVVMENPVGVLGTMAPMPKPHFVQPYDFGHDASKKTGFFLHNLPPLEPTIRFPGRWVMDKGILVERWSNQTDTGHNVLGPSDDRAEIRGRTYDGIAEAMAKQWSAFMAAETLELQRQLIHKLRTQS